MFLIISVKLRYEWRSFRQNDLLRIVGDFFLWTFSGFRGFSREKTVDWDDFSDAVLRLVSPWFSYQIVD